MAIESLSDEINRLRRRIEMFDDKTSNQSVEEKEITIHVRRRLRKCSKLF
jgi:hypothetical protein